VELQELLAAIWLQGFYQTWCLKRGLSPEPRVFYRTAKQLMQERQRNRVYH
jgi:hypothetical protein